MEVKLTMTIRQKELAPKYSGKFIIFSEEMGVNKTFDFVFRSESSYRVPGVNPADFEQLIKLTKGRKIFIRVVGKITGRNVPKMTPEQHVILGLFLQMFDIASRKLSSEHGLNTRNASNEVLAQAADSTIQSTIETKADVPDPATQKVICAACV